MQTRGIKLELPSSLLPKHSAKQTSAIVPAESNASCTSVSANPDQLLLPIRNGCHRQPPLQRTDATNYSSQSCATSCHDVIKKEPSDAQKYGEVDQMVVRATSLAGSGEDSTFLPTKSIVKLEPKRIADQQPSCSLLQCNLTIQRTLPILRAIRIVVPNNALLPRNGLVADTSSSYAENPTKPEITDHGLPGAINIDTGSVADRARIAQGPRISVNELARKIAPRAISPPIRMKTRGVKLSLPAALLPPKERSVAALFTSLKPPSSFGHDSEQEPSGATEDRSSTQSPQRKSMPSSIVDAIKIMPSCCSKEAANNKMLNQCAKRTSRCAYRNTKKLSRGCPSTTGQFSGYPYYPDSGDDHPIPAFPTITDKAKRPAISATGSPPPVKSDFQSKKCIKSVRSDVNGLQKLHSTPPAKGNTPRSTARCRRTCLDSSSSGCETTPYYSLKPLPSLSVSLPRICLPASTSIGGSAFICSSRHSPTQPSVCSGLVNRQSLDKVRTDATGVGIYVTAFSGGTTKRGVPGEDRTRDGSSRISSEEADLTTAPGSSSKSVVRCAAVDSLPEDEVRIHAGAVGRQVDGKEDLVSPTKDGFQDYDNDQECLNNSATAPELDLEELEQNLQLAIFEQPELSKVSWQDDVQSGNAKKRKMSILSSGSKMSRMLYRKAPGGQEGTGQSTSTSAFSKMSNSLPRWTSSEDASRSNLPIQSTPVGDTPLGNTPKLETSTSHIPGLHKSIIGGPKGNTGVSDQPDNDGSDNGREEKKSPYRGTLTGDAFSESRVTLKVAKAVNSVKTLALSSELIRNTGVQLTGDHDLSMKNHTDRVLSTGSGAELFHKGGSPCAGKAFPDENDFNQSSITSGSVKTEDHLWSGHSNGSKIQSSSYVVYNKVKDIAAVGKVNRWNGKYASTPGNRQAKADAKNVSLVIDALYAELERAGTTLEDEEAMRKGCAFGPHRGSSPDGIGPSGCASNNDALAGDSTEQDFISGTSPDGRSAGCCAAPTSGKGYNCCVCGNQFHTSISLDNHICEHSNGTRREQAIRCRICGASLKHMWGLKAHLLAVHLKKGKRKIKKDPESGDPVVICCDICQAGFGKRSELNRHYRNDHFRQHSFPAALSKTSYPCPHCCRVYAGRKTFSRHLTTVHNTECLPDDVVLQTVPSSKHLLPPAHHACLCCPETFSTATELAYHMNRVHDRWPFYACPRCPAFETPFAADLARHERECHSDDVICISQKKHNRAPPSCHLCGRQFECLRELRKHRREEHDGDAKIGSLSNAASTKPVVLAIGQCSNIIPPTEIVSQVTDLAPASGIPKPFIKTESDPSVNAPIAAFPRKGRNPKPAFFNSRRRQVAIAAASGNHGSALLSAKGRAPISSNWSGKGGDLPSRRGLAGRDGVRATSSEIFECEFCQRIFDSCFALDQHIGFVH